MCVMILPSEAVNSSTVSTLQSTLYELLNLEDQDRLNVEISDGDSEGRRRRLLGQEAWGDREWGGWRGAVWKEAGLEGVGASGGQLVRRRFLEEEGESVAGIQVEYFDDPGESSAVARGVHGVPILLNSTEVRAMGPSLAWLGLASVPCSSL